eukprot:841158_1
MILGVCNDENTHFNSESLQESITNIIPNQPISISNKLTHSIAGLKLQMNNEIKICMKHINNNGITSNNVGYILNNNDIIPCNNPNQLGLPCESLQLSQTQTKFKPIENGKNVLQTGTNIASDIYNKSTEISFVEKGTNIVKKGSINVEINKKSDTIAIATRTSSYIKFVFIGIMIFICLHAIFCVLLAFRQSGALDHTKYFNYNDSCVEIVENENDNINNI